MSYNRLRLLISGLCALVLFSVVSTGAFAQGVTTSGITGFVTSQGGTPVAGATVTVTHIPSGTRSDAVTRSNGEYDVAGLRPGGPYSVTANAQGYTAQTEQSVELEVGQVSKVDISLSNEVVTLNAVTVTASQDPTFSGQAMSNVTTFNSQQVMQIATIRRDIQDIQNLDPRAVVMQVSPSDSQYAVSFDGQNPRENLLLVDGVSATDNFGLNSNGVAGFRNPVPPEWIDSITIDTNPFDVIYSDFSGGVTNITIKSGTNEYHGDIYEIYTGSMWRGPDPVIGLYGAHEPVQEHTTGFTIGGPILKDKVFFFIGYDAFREITVPAVQNFLPDNSGGVISQIIAHTESAYNFNPGSLTAPAHIWQQNFVGKLDWNINDAQKFEFTFRHTDGLAPVYYNYTGSFETSLSASWYATHRTDQSYTAKLNSDWSSVVPNLQTEIEATYKRYNGTAELNGADFPAVQIAGVPGTSIAGGTPPYELYLGQYWAYQDNNIYTWEQEEHAYGQYSIGNHTLKFGVQFDRTGYTDTFIPNILGTYFFDSPAEYLANTPTYVQQETPYPGYSLGSDVSHYYQMNVSPLIEDTWRPNEALTVTAGLRLDYPDEPQNPPFSPLFYSAYGYRNNTTGNGNYVFSPRVGFNYTLPTERKTQIRGGAGLVVGTFPVVWYENSFNNAGQLNTVTAGSTSSTATTPTLAFNGNPYIFNGVNSPSLVAAGAAPSTAVPSFDVIDPKFQMPSNWKENIAIDHELPFWHIVMTLDADFSQVNKDVKIYQLNYQTATSGPAYMPDGAIRYAGNITAGVASTTGTYGTQYTTSTSATYLFAGTTSTSSTTLQANKATGPVYYLTNTDKGGSQVFAIDFHTPFIDGWSWSLGYAHVHATQVDPAPSSVASSGYSDIYGINPNDNIAYRSEYAVPDKVVATLSRQFNFFRHENAMTTISAQFLAQTGQAYSVVFKGDANGDGISDSSLFYVPSGPNDPKVSWASTTDEANFFTYLAANPDIAKYEGEIIPRNALYAPWQRTVNLHVEQQIPIYGPARLVVFADCFNFANLLNRSWGVVADYDNSFNVRTIAGTGYNASTGQYVYVFNPSTVSSTQINSNTGQSLPGTIYSDMSRYSLQIGARLEF